MAGSPDEEAVSGAHEVCRVAAAAAALSVAVAGAAAADSPCRGSGAVEQATVRAVTDALTLQLADGRSVRLAGIEVPAAPSVPAPDSALGKDTAVRARDFLAGELTGKPIHLYLVGSTADRHGRLRAYIFVDRAADAKGLERSIQQAMVIHGLARVSARVGDPVCAAALRADEDGARRAGAGVWGLPDHAVRRAGDPEALRRLRGRFVLVEGRLLSVRESGATMYLNFGRRWSEDFTATIARRNLRHFEAGGVNPRRLERRTVRVRGWIEERGGPWIELLRPEQIEVVGN